MKFELGVVAMLPLEPRKDSYETRDLLGCVIVWSKSNINATSALAHMQRHMHETTLTRVFSSITSNGVPWCVAPLSVILTLQLGWQLNES